jgi:hypothetical protein
MSTVTTGSAPLKRDLETSFDSFEKGEPTRRDGSDEM